MATRAYNTRKNMNRKVYFYGYTVFQLMLVFLCCSLLLIIGVMVNPLFFGLFALVLSVSLWLGNKINKENKNGNPDFFSAEEIRLLGPKYFVDDKNILKYLKK